MFKKWENGDFVVNKNTGLNEPSGFAKEIKYLRDRGIKKVKFKDGTQLDIETVDLNDLDWKTNWTY